MLRLSKMILLLVEILFPKMSREPAVLFWFWIIIPSNFTLCHITLLQNFNCISLSPHVISALVQWNPLPCIKWQAFNDNPGHGIFRHIVKLQGDSNMRLNYFRFLWPSIMKSLGFSEIIAFIKLLPAVIGMSFDEPNAMNRYTVSSKAIERLWLPKKITAIT